MSMSHHGTKGRWHWPSHFWSAEEGVAVWAAAARTEATPGEDAVDIKDVPVGVVVVPIERAAVGHDLAVHGVLELLLQEAVPVALVQPAEVLLVDRLQQGTPMCDDLQQAVSREG